MKTVLIVGGGIVGLAAALELATRDLSGNPLSVTVLERGQVMREASWAAAGMLAASDPENPALLGPLASFSLSLYPEFLRRVASLSGCSVPFRTANTLQVSPHARTGFAHLTPDEAASRVPGFHLTLPRALLWLEERSIDPRDLCRALPMAARAAGVHIHEDCPVLDVRAGQNGVTVRTPLTEYSADALIVACGAWSGTVAGLDTACVPRKGQMLAVRMPADHPCALPCVLRSPEIYLVPRGRTGADAGRIIVGATVEDAGFDRTIQPAATEWLREKAAELWPPIGEAQVEDVWTGIRPGTADSLPLIGPMAGDAAVWMAAGHYRNGILLAPGTARLLAEAMLHPEREPAVSLAPFDPARFSQALSPAAGYETEVAAR